MDHLATSQERRDRWYSKLWPRYIPVVKAKDWQEALASQETYDCARSIPIDWLSGATPSDGSADVKLRSVLEEHGFVVISGVLTESECKEALSLGWDYLEAASVAEWQLQHIDDGDDAMPPLKRNDASTHKDNMPRSVEGGMLPYYGSGHSTLAWFVRSHPKVIDIFRSMYRTDNLISSLDGLVLWSNTVGAIYICHCCTCGVSRPNSSSFQSYRIKQTQAGFTWTSIPFTSQIRVESRD
jgi:hypothetical protein